DPCRCLCSWLRAPKIGHNYVLARTPGSLRSSKLLLTMGPHWTGVLFASAVTLGATVALIIQDGPQGTNWFKWFCVSGAGLTLLTLWLTGCSDPGIVRQPANADMDARMCPECAMMVPGTAEHCYDCCVCIEGLDHHCIWMGKCIGKQNMTIFKVFNVTWVAYLVVSLIYITVGGKRR
ncbi:DHHC palmitoyltransferase-domain-containing protein, partial [Tribonema minus]